MTVVPSARVRALIRAAHPGPSLAITVMIVALAAEAGLRPQVLILLVPAVLAGEVSIGWSNDAFDADRDAAAGRANKPIVSAAISRRAVAWAAGFALAAGAVLCWMVSPATGVINLIMMAAGWGYNAGLKSTSASGVMYLVGFGLIPALVASALPGHHPARPWALGAAGLIGLGGHFANVLPDLDGDRAAGVRGLPQRVAAAGGSGLVRLVALVLLLSASVLIVFGRRSGPAWYDLLGLAAAVILAIGGGWAPGRLPFLAAIGVAAIDVGLFASGGLVS